MYTTQNSIRRTTKNRRLSQHPGSNNNIVHRTVKQTVQIVTLVLVKINFEVLSQWNNVLRNEQNSIAYRAKLNTKVK